MLGRRRRQSSLTTRPRVRDPSAPPLVKSYLSKKNFIDNAAAHEQSGFEVAVSSRAAAGWTQLRTKIKIRVVEFLGPRYTALVMWRSTY
jgi:hypothetical protein